MVYVTLTSCFIRFSELVSKRVLVMDFVEGSPLNRLQETMKERGIEPGSPEAKIAGRRILNSLSSAFGRMIFGAGFIHGDPHPGNIFVGEGGSVSLIDCGQFKALPRMQRVQLAKLILQVDEYQKAEGSEAEEAKRKLAGLIRDFGVKFMPEYEKDDDLGAAVALFLFGDSDRALPGGFSTSELGEFCFSVICNPPHCIYFIYFSFLNLCSFHLFAIP